MIDDMGKVCKACLTIYRNPSLSLPSFPVIARHQGCQSNLGKGLPRLRLAMTQRTTRLVSNLKWQIVIYLEVSPTYLN